MKIKYNYKEVVISENNFKTLYCIKAKVFIQYYLFGIKLPYEKYCFMNLKFYDKIRKVSGNFAYDLNGWTLFDAYKNIIYRREGGCKK